MEIKHAYACGSPVRQKVVEAAARSVGAEFHPEANPGDRGGNSIIWGLIRGSPELIQKHRAGNRVYWHMDNGYFGRNKYFRISPNANQVTDLHDAEPTRFERIKSNYGVEISEWKTSGDHILLALSTEWLYRFMGTELNVWLNQTVAELKKHTDRKIVVRPKDAKGPIENDLQNAFALVTHTSCAALDALRMGVPVFTTGECCAKPLALQDLSKIESPIRPEREPLFWHLSYRMFTPTELEQGMWKECYEFS